MSCSNRILPCASLWDMPALGADPGGVGICCGGAELIGGMDGAELDWGPKDNGGPPSKVKSAVWRWSLWTLVPDMLEETEPAFPDAGVAGPAEWGCS